FLIEQVFVTDEISLVYSLYDRYIVGGAYPVKQKLKLETFHSLKADYFLERREMGIINVGGRGTVIADGTAYEIGYKEALYLGKGTKEVSFESASTAEPAKFYINSAPAHQQYPSKRITLAEAEIVELGDLKTSNARRIN